MARPFAPLSVRMSCRTHVADGISRRNTRDSSMKKVITLSLMLLVVLGGGAGVWYWQARAAGRASFRTAAVERGYLEAVISATGTLEPEEVIDVGAQVAGRIEHFGKDPQDPSKTINYGAGVDVGTVLAELDPSLYQARRDAAK